MPKTERATTTTNAWPFSSTLQHPFKYLASNISPSKKKLVYVSLLRGGRGNILKHHLPPPPPPPPPVLSEIKKKERKGKVGDGKFQLESWSFSPSFLSLFLLLLLHLEEEEKGGKNKWIWFFMRPRYQLLQWKSGKWEHDGPGMDFLHAVNKMERRPRVWKGQEEEEK